MLKNTVMGPTRDDNKSKLEVLEYQRRGVTLKSRITIST